MKKIKSNITPPKSIYSKIVPPTTYWELGLLFFIGGIIFTIIHS